MARSSANSASMEMPTRRNGKDTSHTKGQRKMARMATGQHNTNNRHHTTNKSMVFTERPLFAAGDFTIPLGLPP